MDSGHSQPLFLFVVFSPNYQSRGASRNRLAAIGAIGIESEVTVGAADFRFPLMEMTRSTDDEMAWPQGAS